MTRISINSTPEIKQNKTKEYNCPRIFVFGFGFNTNMSLLSTALSFYTKYAPFNVNVNRQQIVTIQCVLKT